MMRYYEKSSFYPWLVISFSALFLFYKYVLQISPSVITDQLMQHFHLNGEGLGILVAIYFITYLTFQLLAGPLLDRLSPRVMTSLAIAISGLGAILFGTVDSLTAAWIARACIGLGAAFATVSYMKMATSYFKPRQFALIGGLLATAAMLGSMGGEAPFAYLVAGAGWQKSLIYCGIAGFVFAALFFLVIKDKKVERSQVKASISWHDVLKVLIKKENWFLMLYSGLAFVPLQVFGGLWGNAFLRAAYGISETSAANLSTLMFAGLAIGAPLFGYMSDRLNNRYSLMFAGLWISMAAFLCVIYIPYHNFYVLGTLLFIFGLASGAFMLCFAVGRDLNNIAMMATVTSFINTGEGILGLFSEPLIGRILDIFWQGKKVNGVPLFSVSDYHLALFILPLYLLLAIVFLSFLSRSQKKSGAIKIAAIPASSPNR